MPNTGHLNILKKIVIDIKGEIDRNTIVVED